MVLRFYWDLLLEDKLLEEKSIFVQEEIKAQKGNPIWVQEELLVTQGKINVQKEEEHITAEEEAKEEIYIFLEIQEKEVETKTTLEVMPPNDP